MRNTIVFLTVAMSLLLSGSWGQSLWPLTESNSSIRDSVTLHDFVPLGIEVIETTGHQLIYPPDDPQWRLSCFILVAMGTTPEGDTIILQERLPLYGYFSERCRISTNPEWRCLYSVSSPMYYDDGDSLFPYPTVYVFGEYPDSGGECIASISFNESEREWIYMVRPTSGEGDTVEIHCHPRSVPFWMGKVEGPYIIHGAIFNVEDLDIWGGFWELGTCEGRVVLPGRGSWTFEGNFLWDRAYHRVYYSDSVGRAAGAPLAFSCFGIFHSEFDIMITNSVNPSPIDPPVPFQHQGRINFHARGEDFAFTEFTYSDNGGLQPDEHYLTGTFPGGEVNLTGRVFLFYPNTWGVYSSVWWDSTAFRDWGRAFIIWTGTVVLHGDTIYVDDAWGVGEFTRFADDTTKIAENIPPLPEQVSISVHPNPFNSSCIITVPVDAQIKIYDLRGKLVKGQLVNLSESSKTRTIIWQPEKTIPSGVYLVKAMTRDGQTSEKKILLIK